MQLIIEFHTYRISDNKAFTFHFTFFRPRCCRSGFDKLGRLALYVRELFNSLDCDLSTGNNQSED